LGVLCCGFRDIAFGNDGDAAMVGCLEGIGEAGDAAADNKNITFNTHDDLSLPGFHYGRPNYCPLSIVCQGLRVESVPNSQVSAAISHLVGCKRKFVVFNLWSFVVKTGLFAMGHRWSYRLCFMEGQRLQ
jgi:hypothetical protein